MSSYQSNNTASQIHPMTERAQRSVVCSVI